MLIVSVDVFCVDAATGLFVAHAVAVFALRCSFLRFYCELVTHLHLEPNVSRWKARFAKSADFFQEFAISCAMQLVAVSEMAVSSRQSSTYEW